MDDLKYTVSIDGIPCAEHMTLEYALMLTEAVLTKFSAEALDGMSVTITNEVQEETTVEDYRLQTED